MTAQTFQALWVEEQPDKGFTRRIVERRTDDLPAGDVLVRVAYSSLNYKDMLSATGNRGVTRRFPHTPGIDAAGTVVESADGALAPGDEVIVTSYDLGMNTPGGFGQYTRVPAEWVVPLPPGLTLRESMAYGTAGFTAALSVMELLENGVVPENGSVLVSGATGGVGSVAVAVLAKLGFFVAAVDGRRGAGDYLRRLGAAEVLPREEAVDASGRPMLKGRWAGVVDAVGGDILATAIRSIRPRGVVTCCGNTASPDLPITVFPFILRGGRLVGIDSQNCPMEPRRRAWGKLAGEWKVEGLDAVVREIPLGELDDAIEGMRAGGRQGRTVVRLRE